MLLPVSKNPPAKAMIDKLAPNTAALLTPSVEGEAIALPKVDCMMSPATDNPAPAMTAAIMRGILMFQMILLFAFVLLWAKAFNPSIKDMLLEPTNKLKKMDKNNTPIMIARKMILPFAFLI